jgi:hypothetical protein
MFYDVGSIVKLPRTNLLVPLKVEVIEEKYRATFIGEFGIEKPNGFEQLVQLYHQETPPDPSYGNYFAMFVRDGKAFITSGRDIKKDELVALNVGGEFLYSRERHDFRKAKSCDIWIDGGAAYTRIVGDLSLVRQFLTFKIEGPNIVITSAKDRFNG